MPVDLKGLASSPAEGLAIWGMMLNVNFRAVEVLPDGFSTFCEKKSISGLTLMSKGRVTLKPSGSMARVKGLFPPDQRSLNNGSSLLLDVH